MVGTMSRAIQKITVTSIDAEIMEISAEGWDGLVRKMGRRASKPLTVKRPVVYVLYTDHFDRVTHGARIYVGHTDDLVTRLADHDKNKDFWTVALIFSSVGDWMNTAFTQNVEHAFIKWANEANRYKVENLNQSDKTHLGADDQVRLNEFLGGVQQVLRLAGIDIFQLNLDSVFTFAHKWHGVLRYCRLKIDSTSPLKVYFLAGSEIYANETESSALSSAGATYIEETLNWRFTTDAVVPVTRRTIDTIFGISASRWLSQTNVGLDKVLKTFVS